MGPLLQRVYMAWGDESVHNTKTTFACVSCSHSPTMFPGTRRWKSVITLTSLSSTLTGNPPTLILCIFLFCIIISVALYSGKTLLWAVEK